MLKDAITTERQVTITVTVALHPNGLASVRLAALAYLAAGVVQAGEHLPIAPQRAPPVPPRSAQGTPDMAATWTATATGLGVSKPGTGRYPSDRLKAL